MADIEAAADRGENTALMEPLLLREQAPGRAELEDLALSLASSAAALRSSLPLPIHTALADLVRAMNCYYSNLIEGHDTHPVDIERALRNDFSHDPRQRDLQLEARAHISVQAWLDAGGLKGRETTVEGIREVHRRFCELLPETLLRIEDPATGEYSLMAPGELRQRDVQVGRHIAVSPGALPRFLTRFEAAYGGNGRMSLLLSAASAHHRLLWIHPFLDGNGRVARLMSHALLLDMLDSGGVWSVARGLARRLDEYKRHLAACDMPKRNDLDGRGQLSEEAQLAFTRFFLEVCLDQVEFMRRLIDPSRLHERIKRWAEEAGRESGLSGHAATVLEALLYRGELRRADVPGLIGASDRHARRVTAWLLEQGALSSDGPRSPLQLAFPAALAPHWMPGLFPA